MTIPLQTGIVYGPMSSRRFGRSLGINLLPGDQKVCNFDCIYCQYGESRAHGPISFPNIDEIASGFKDFVDSQNNESFLGRDTAIDWIIIAGNGEPTLHPQFNKAVDEILLQRDKYLPAVPVGILSNSSTCYRTHIQDALMKLEGRFMKLDAGYNCEHERVNGSLGEAKWSNIIGGLYHLRGPVLQSMFFTGSMDNTKEDVVEEWMRAVHYIQPKTVQIYSIDRSPKDEGLRPVPYDVLRKISEKLFFYAAVPSVVF